MRVQITLTGDRAEQFERKKEGIEERLGHEVSNPVALGILMNPDVADEMLKQRAKR